MTHQPANVRAYECGRACHYQRPYGSSTRGSVTISHSSAKSFDRQLRLDQRPSALRSSYKPARTHWRSFCSACIGSDEHPIHLVLIGYEGEAERSGGLAESRSHTFTPRLAEQRKRHWRAVALSYQTRGIVGLADELSPYLGTDTQLRAAGCIVAVAVRSPLQRCPRFTPGSFVPSRTYQVARLSSGLVDTRATPDFPASEGHLFIQAATSLLRYLLSCLAHSSRPSYGG